MAVSVGFHKICVLGFVWHQVIGHQRSELILLTSRLLVAMAITMLACISGMCGRFVSIAAFLFSNVGHMVHNLASCLSPFILSYLIELKIHTLCF